MKSQKKKWEPRISNVMADGSQLDDLTGYVIPAGHSYYDIILGMNKRELQKGGLNMGYAIYNQEHSRKLYSVK
jgi:hypothetical protein